MKTQKDFEEWALTYLKKIQKILLLEDHYPLDFHFGCADKNSHADCKFMYPYKTIEIRYEMSLFELWKEKKIDDVKSILTHEMSHVLTDPLYAKAMSRFLNRDEIEDERERLTDHIANIIMKNIDT